jgi:hypothetical protein
VTVAQVNSCGGQVLAHKGPSPRILRSPEANEKDLRYERTL